MDASKVLQAKRAEKKDKHKQNKQTRERLKLRVEAGYSVTPDLNQSLLTEAMDIITKESSNLLADKRALKFAAWQSKYEHLKTLLTHNRVQEATQMHQTAIEHPLRMFRGCLGRGRERLLSLGFRRSHFSDQWPALSNNMLGSQCLLGSTFGMSSAVASSAGASKMTPPSCHFRQWTRQAWSRQLPLISPQSCAVSAHCPCRHFNDTNHKPRPTTAQRWSDVDWESASCSEEVHTPPKVAPKCVLDLSPKQPKERRKQEKLVGDDDNNSSTSAGAPGLSDRRSRAFTSREQ